MSVLLNAGGLTIITSVVVFLLIILILVIIILIAKTKLMPSGNAEITINNKEKITAPLGVTLLNALQTQGIFLPSACGGSGTCGQCRCRVAGSLSAGTVGATARGWVDDFYAAAFSGGPCRRGIGG